MKKIIFSKEQIRAFSKTFLLFNVVVIGLPFALRWGGTLFEKFQSETVTLFNEGFWTFFWVWCTIYLKLIAGLVGGIILHELLHALTFLLFAEKGLQSIKFGFIEKPFVPYVHCTDVLPVWAYRLGIIMPGLLLGVIPGIMGIWTGSFYLTLFGLFFTGAAAGDALLFKATLAFDGKRAIRDLPGEMGFEIVN